MEQMHESVYTCVRNRIRVSTCSRMVRLEIETHKDRGFVHVCVNERVHLWTGEHHPLRGAMGERRA